MSALVFAFGALQAIGAVVGAGGAVFAEIFYLDAIRDGVIDAAERAHLRIIAHSLRWGMLLVLLSSICLVLLNFIYEAWPQPALTAAYWTEMALVFVIIYASWAMSKRIISFTLGSAAVFSAWWYVALLVFGKMPALSFGASLALYAVSTAILFGLLLYARMLTKPA